MIHPIYKMSMQSKVQALQNVVSRKGSAKVLTFSVPHVFKALQMLFKDQFVSRNMFCNELHMGEGAVKTMIAHLKEESFVNSTKSGTYLTSKGRNFVKLFHNIMDSECAIPKCNIARSKHNFGVILRKYSSATKSGMEQRDYAVLYGASGATTIQYKEDQFVFPKENIDCLAGDPKTKKILVDNLRPNNGDLIIIASADDPFVAEIAAKNSALWTLAIHR